MLKEVGAQEVGCLEPKTKGAGKRDFSAEEGAGGLGKDMEQGAGGLGKDMDQGEPTSPLFLSAGPNVSRREALGLSSERPCSCPLFGDSRG